MATKYRDQIDNNPQKKKKIDQLMATKYRDQIDNNPQMLGRN